MSATTAPAPTNGKPFPIALIAALAVALVIALMPPPDGLSIAGQRILAILAFAVIVWLTEALDYAVSSVVIVALIALALGSAPIGTTPELLGTSRALAKALSGFSNSALALVAAALFLSVAMTATGLDRRIAYRTLNRFSTTAKGILVGAIAVTIILSLMVPSATARVACIVPIMTGIIAAFGVEKRSLFAASLMIVVAQATSIWNMGIMTSAAQNMLTVGFLEKSIKLTPSWSDWFIAGAPYAAVMSVVLFVLVRRLMPPEK
jgi:sodium-dependent dicarboxylate transporter 2/3/5